MSAEQDMDDDLGGKSINDLPDALLQHILSFLSTKDAFRTSILSKKWEHLCNSISNLEFTQPCHAKRNILMNFVDRVLVLRDDSDIEEFSVSLSCSADDAPRIRTWVSAAVHRNVKVLCVQFYYRSELESSWFVFPRCLFTSAKLTKLQIIFHCVLRLPSSISLSCLKILTLALIIFPDDDSTQRLLNLPTLEELNIRLCNWKNLKEITISAPKLQRLNIDERYGNSSDACKVMIFGTALTWFSFKCGFWIDYCLFISSPQVEGYFHVYNYDGISRQIAYHAYKFLVGLSSVKRLELSTTVFEVLDCAAELFAHPPTFMNLTTLQFDSAAPYLDLHHYTFWHILYNSPHLKALSFRAVTLSELPSNCVGEDLILEPVPRCFLSCLKCIDIRNLCGGGGGGGLKELDAVTLLLKNAIALDIMVITCSIPFYSKGSWEKRTKRKIRKRLLELPRWSEIGKLNFV